jgi:putative Mg2+ transporter-C (MgtC) family protein
MGFGEILLRLIAAAVVGGLVGLNRDLHGKPTGVPTLGLVGLGSALVVLAMAGAGNSSDTSRIIQGIVTGIGFLGAGVIIRPMAKARVHGLTTAACVWLTAALGAACGLGAWRVLVVGVPLAFLLLVFGKSVEHLSHYVSRNGSDVPDA